MPSNKKIVITGGGTGGHVFPALAIAEELRKRSWTVLYVGTSHGMEAKLVPERNFPFYTVKTGALKNQGLLKKFQSVFALTKGTFWAIRFLRQEQPSVVLGVGGYVSAPVCLAAFLLRVPVYLQEQNASVGIANRLLGKLAKTIFLGFQDAAAFFPKGRTLFTGNPLREVFFTEVAPFDAGRNHLLVLGGSQGARAINQAIGELLPRLHKEFPGLTITHQTGQSDCAPVTATYAEKFPGPHTVQPFIKDMIGAYNESSVIVCRSGALTVSELVQVGRPAIFVPYPRRGQNDQTANAALVAKAEAGLVVEQGPDFTERLWTALKTVLLPQTLESMARKFSALRSPNGLDSIATHLEAEILH